MKLALLMSLALNMTSAFEYRTSDPAMLFPYTVASSDSAVPSSLISPVTMNFGQGLSLASSASRPYSEDSLKAATSSVRYTWAGGGTQVSWNRFGDKAYTEDSLSASGAFALFRYFKAGISGNMHRLAVQGDTENYSTDFFTSDLSLSFSPLSSIDLAYIHTGLFPQFTEESENLIYPEKSAGITARPGRGLSLSWNITDSASGYINTLSFTVLPVRSLALRGGYSRETCSFAGSATAIVKGICVTYGFRIHSYLGATHSLGISYTGGTFPGPINSGPLKKTSPAPVDINSASYEEMVNLPEMNEVRARRIILYREKIGPVSDASLYRIGMKGEEIRRLRENIYGLEEDVLSGRHSSKRKSRKFRPRKYRKNPGARIRSLFRKMLALGIDPASALKYSEAAVKRKRELPAMLNADPGISTSDKTVIKKLCGIR